MPIHPDKFDERGSKKVSQNVATASSTAESPLPTSAGWPKTQLPVHKLPAPTAAIQPGARQPHGLYIPAIIKLLGVIVVVLMAIIAGLLWNRKGGTPGPNPVNDVISDTRWLGSIGRAPASLDILARNPDGFWNARMTYEGIVEDLTVRLNHDRSIVLVGQSFHRESGSGAFALDTFYGSLSEDGQQLRGSLQDNAQRSGYWHLAKIGNVAESLAAEASTALSPNGTSMTRWQGRIGKWPAVLEIFARPPSGEWFANATYRGVVEHLSVTIKDDGTVVLVGQSYESQVNAASFSLDTFYGQFSPDRRALQGLRTDAAGSRGQWKVTLIANGPTPAGVSYSGQGVLGFRYLGECRSCS